MNYYYLLLGIQYVFISVFVLFAIHRYAILWMYFRTKKNAKQYSWPPEKPLPIVTIQIPIFNEFHVAKRIIDAVCAFDYPKELLNIQVLDDSTDDTKAVVAQCVKDWQVRGTDIHHLHRDDRTGFKAGALDAGMATAKGEFIAIFDADFVPNPDTIRKLLAPFSNSTIGMSQARWGHINRSHSVLTEVQALLLDSHFILEQSARNLSGRFMNFNGTAGMWRKVAIENSGGWQHDTLTEDMDLSYRAQLAGWKFVFLPEVICPAELPVNMNAFKTQQHRWVKGAIETGKKLYKAVLLSDQPIKIKTEAMLHLFANISYPLNIFISLAWLPGFMIGLQYKIVINYYIGLFLFLLATMPFIIFFLAAQREISTTWWKKIVYIPALMAVGIGLTVNNGIAVLEALVDYRSEFTRTPKYGTETSSSSWKKKRYSLVKSKTLLWEGLLICYLAVTLIFAIKFGFWGTVPFIALFFVSFLYVAMQSCWHSLRVSG